LSSIEPNWPDIRWPYNAGQLDEIRACLRTDRERCVSQILDAARVFAALKTGPAKKPHPADEIATVKARAIDLHAALSRLSQEADAHLLKNWRETYADIHGEPVTREGLLSCLHRFIHENEAGFSNPPAPSPGPIVQLNEARFIYQLELAFTAGHGGQFTARGWPKFFKLCWGPMAALGLVDHLSDRSLQRKFTEARQYFGSIHSQ
jgi:hypothetical protein